MNRNPNSTLYCPFTYCTMTYEDFRKLHLINPDVPCVRIKNLSCKYSRPCVLTDDSDA